MIKYIGYIRVSTEEQGKSGLGLAAQRSAIEAHAGEGLVAVYEEIASGGILDRPVLSQALQHAQEAGAVLVALRLDRLTRRVRQVEDWLDDGADFQTTDGTLDTTSPHGRASLRMMVVFAELERELIGQRITEGMAKIPEDDPRHVSHRNRRRARATYEEIAPQVRRFLRDNPGCSNRALGRHLGWDHRRAARARHALQA